MRRCIELSKNIRGAAAPNPAVGSVIVHNDKIIGEGHTSAYGGPHAEVNAINSIKDNSLLTSATLYVSLEPCSHYGKTPPCSELIIKHAIPHVVIGIRDPNPLVAGKGIEMLKKAGCQISEGVLKNQCKDANREFFTYHQKKRPFIILKWAQTSDGFIAPDPELRAKDPEPFWITNSRSRQLVHKWRTEEQAILAGTNTILADNSSLTAREWYGKSPIRIILDRELKIPADYNVFDQSTKTIILTDKSNSRKKIAGIELGFLDFKSPIADQIAQILWKNQILSVIVEGGTKTIETFLDEGLWDEARVFSGPKSIHSGIKAPEIDGKIVSQLFVGTDTLKIISRD